MNDDGNIFYIILLIISILMIWVGFKELIKQKEDNIINKVESKKEEHELIDTKEQEIEKRKETKIAKPVIEKKEEPEIEIAPEPMQEVDTIKIKRDKFIENHVFLKYNNKDAPNYSSVLFETGLLYEELYKNYFKGACYVYLATLLDKKNKEYEQEYIRLCKLVREKNGIEWEYYITLIQDISDIDKYINELLNQNKVKQQPVKKKTVVQQPRPKQIIKSAKVNTSKFEDFNTESYLHSLGYKVGASGLSENQRRKLLKKVLEEGKISKYDVIETLERNISMFGHRSDRRRAVEDWRSDLMYIKRNF